EHVHGFELELHGTPCRPPLHSCSPSSLSPSSLMVFSLQLSVFIFVSVSLLAVMHFAAVNTVHLNATISTTHLLSAASPGPLIVVASPFSLSVHPTPLLGTAPLCISETTGSPQPELELARSVRFCVSEAPTPLHAASDLFTDAVYPHRSDSGSITTIDGSFRLLVSLGTKPPLDAPQGTFMTSLTESYDKWFWVDSVIPLWIQYGNVGFQSHCLNSTIVSISNSVKYIQRVVARHRGTGSSAASIPLWLIVKSISSPPPHRLIIPIPSESCWYSTDTCFGLNQNQLWSLNLPIVINLSHHFSSKASCLSTVCRRASVQRVHLAQSLDVVLKLPLFVHPSQVSRVFISSDFVTGAIRFQGPSYLFVSVKSRIFILFGSVEIHIVSSWSLDVGARAVHARSTSFQTLPFGLINVGSDYFMLVVVTYSGIHLMLPTVLQWTSKTLSFSFVVTCFMFCFMMFIKPLRMPSGSYLVIIEHSFSCLGPPLPSSVVLADELADSAANRFS
ncbi:hypothetical protein IGI04_001912, partial [Brassica rapa subsp. trilocularis]